MDGHVAAGLPLVQHGVEQARAELSTAVRPYRAMEMAFWLPQTEAALVQVAG